MAIRDNLAVLSIALTVSACGPKLSQVDASVYRGTGGPPEGAATLPNAPAPAQERRASPETGAATAAFEPMSASPQRGAIALVVGIEAYRALRSPVGARNDAARVAALMSRTFGITSERIRVLEDARATRSDVLAGVQWLKENARPGGRAYFYFSGHGAPDPSTGESYLLPYEATADNLLESGVKLSDVLTALSESKAHDAVAVVDAAFTGTGDRSFLAAGTRALTRVKEPQVASRVALLRSSKPDEGSGPTSDGKLGAFTMFVTEGLGTGAADVNGDGQITAKELLDWAGPRVAREALRQNRKQTPELAMPTGAAATGDDLVLSYGYR